MHRRIPNFIGEFSPSPPRPPVEEETCDTANDSRALVPILDAKQQRQLVRGTEHKSFSYPRSRSVIQQAQTARAPITLSSSNNSNTRSLVRDAVLSIAEPPDPSMVHARGIGRRQLPPLALELSSYVRRELARVDRERAQLSLSPLHGTRGIAAKLSVVRETIACLQNHFPAYNEVLGDVVCQLDQVLQFTSNQVAKQLSELELLRHSSDGIVEQRLHEAKEEHQKQIIALLAQRAQDQEKLREATESLHRERGNANYERRRNIALTQELEQMTNRTQMFQKALDEETKRSISLTQRLSKLTSTNTTLRHNVEFLDRLLREAETQIERATKLSRIQQKQHQLKEQPEQDQQQSSEKSKKKEKRRHSRKRRGTTVVTDPSSPEQATRLTLAKVNRQQLAELKQQEREEILPSHLHLQDSLATGSSSSRGSECSSDDDDDEGQAEGDVRHEGERNNNHGNGSNDDDDEEFDDEDDDNPNVPVPRRADQAFFKELGSQREKMFSLDAKMRRLAGINEELRHQVAELQHRLDRTVRAAEQDRSQLTPRPTWVRVADVLPSFTLNASASSEEALEDVLLSIEQELRSVRHEAEARIMGNVVRDWLTSENLGESDLVGRTKHFISRGEGPNVPVYLRAPPGRIENKRLTKYGVESILKKFWGARRKYLGYPTSQEIAAAHGDKKKQEEHRQRQIQRLEQQRANGTASGSSNGSSSIMTIDVFFIDFLINLTGSASRATTLAYNIIAVAQQFKADPDCVSLLRVLNNEISEFAVYASVDVVATLERALNAADASRKGTLSRSTIHRVLLHFFRGKANEDMLRLRLNLALSCNGASLVDLRSLFAEDSQCNESPFVVCLRSQALDEALVFATEVEHFLRTNAADRSTGFIDAVAARDNLKILDPAMPDDVVQLVVAAGCAMTPKELDDALRRGDMKLRYPTEPFLERIRRNVGLKRYSALPIFEQDDPSTMVLSASTAGAAMFASDNKQQPQHGARRSNNNQNTSSLAATSMLGAAADPDDEFFDFMKRLVVEEEDDDDEANDYGAVTTSDVAQRPLDESTANNNNNNEEDGGEKLTSKEKQRLANLMRRSISGPRRKSIYLEKEVDALLAEDDGDRIFGSLSTQRARVKPGEEDDDDDDNQERRLSRRSSSVSGTLERKTSLWQRPIVPSSDQQQRQISRMANSRLAPVAGGGGGVSSVVTAVVAAENFRRLFANAKQERQAQQAQQPPPPKRKSLVSILAGSNFAELVGKEDQNASK